MALATLADVKRWLGRSGDSSIDGDVTPILEAVEEWIAKHTGRVFDGSGTQVQKFYNVRYDEVLYLKDPNPVVTEVKVFRTAGASGTVLTADSGYQLQNEGALQLIYRQGFITDEGPGAPVNHPEGYGRTFIRHYDKVQVTYTPAASVPKMIREATAMIAAATYAQTEATISDLASETLGDYSYSRAAGSEVVIPARALEFLRPYRKTKVRST